MCNPKIVSKALVLAFLLAGGGAATAAPARAAQAADSRPALLRAWSWLEIVLSAWVPALSGSSLDEEPQGVDQGVCIDPMGGRCAASSEMDQSACIDPIGRR